MKQITTIASEQEMQEFGQTLGKTLIGGNIIALSGDLGAGKTTLVQGIGRGLGVLDHITSPTFTILNIYPLPTANHNCTTLAHIDTYRLENEQELAAIGIHDYLGQKNTICIIEWPEKIPELLAGRSLISITINQIDTNTRQITTKHT